MVKILVLRNKATIWSPHGIIIMPTHCEPPREVSPLRDHRNIDTVDKYKQYLAQRRKQQEALRDRRRDRSNRSRPKRQREQAERRAAAAAQTAAKAAAAKAAVVDAARQRAAAEQRLAALNQRHVHSLSACDVPCPYGLQ